MRFWSPTVKEGTALRPPFWPNKQSRFRTLIVPDFMNVYSPPSSKKTTDALGGVHPLFALKEPTAEAAKKSGIPYTFIWANLFGGYSEPALGRHLPMQNDEIDVFGTDSKSERLYSRARWYAVDVQETWETFAWLLPQPFLLASDHIIWR